MSIATEKSLYRILIVDDDDTIRESIVHYLENFHEAGYDLAIESSPDAPEARQRIEQTPFDLIISDINLPHDDGFRLLQFARQKRPQSKTALITAYKVEDYVRLARETGICNIIAKTAPFNFEELSCVVTNLLDPASAFGLKNYLAPESQIHHEVIRNSKQIMETFYRLREFCEKSGVRNVDSLSTALIEAMTNAVYHAAKLPDGTLKYKKGQEIEHLEEHEAVSLYYGRDDDRVGVGIVDQGGRITADEILYWLDRNISGAGLLDSHGRGVYLMHNLVDRLIINISPGERTEIITLDYFSPEYSTNKPLFINQL